jgi:hypothetical protein
MGCGTGDKQTIEFAIPEDQKAIRQKLANLISSNMGQPVAGYGGPLGVAQNPLNLAAANMMMQYMGAGNYKTPSYLNYDQLMKGTPQIKDLVIQTNSGSGATASGNPFGSTGANLGGMESLANNPLIQARLAGYNPYQSR